MANRIFSFPCDEIEAVALAEASETENRDNVGNLGVGESAGRARPRA